MVGLKIETPVGCLSSPEESVEPFQAGFRPVTSGAGSCLCLNLGEEMTEHISRTLTGGV